MNYGHFPHVVSVGWIGSFLSGAGPEINLVVTHLKMESTEPKNVPCRTKVRIKKGAFETKCSARIQLLIACDGIWVAIQAIPALSEPSSPMKTRPITINMASAANATIQSVL